jgi:hypothetical protein
VEVVADNNDAEGISGRGSGGGGFSIRENANAAIVAPAATGMAILSHGYD